MTLLLGCLLAAGSAMAQLKDTFSDGSLGSNSGGTGNGFVSNGQGGSVYESGGYVTLSGSGYSTMVIRSNEAINPYQAAATTATWKFGSIGYDASWQRFWVGYRLNGSNNNHFYPDNPNLQGLYISIISNTGTENNYTYKGNLVAHNGTSRTILASWDWSNLNQLSGLVICLTTTSTNYSLTFSGATATPTFTVGSASGTLTGIGNLGNTYNVGVHNQAATSSTVQVDEIEVSTGITTKVATSISSSGATLNGTSFPAGLSTTAWFEYGTSPTLSGATSTTAQSMGSGSSGVDYSQSISGLQANTTYYFRAVENSSSGTRQGAILSFFTGSEIVVEQPVGTNLTDGSASISFGSALLSSPTTAKTFTIKNTGGVALTGLSITKDGTHASDFTVSALGSTSVAPGASTTITVTLTAAALGARTAAIHIASDDADENPFDISLSGNGVASLPQPAYTITNSNSYSYYSGYTFGSSFSVSEECNVEQLGAYDHDQDGLGAAYQVGLWDESGNLLAQATVDNASPLIGAFRYSPIEPVTLTPGSFYYIGVLTNGVDATTWDGPSFTTDSRVTFGGAWYGYGGSVLAFPTSNYSSEPSMFGANVLLAETVPTYPKITLQQPAGTNIAQGASVGFDPQTPGTGAGNALKFDGMDDSVSVTRYSALDFTNKYTFESWIKIADYQYGTFISKFEDDGDNRGWMVNMGETGDPTKLCVVQSAAGTWTNPIQWNSGWTPALNTWYHIAVVFDATLSSNQIKLYVNGSLQAQTSWYSTLVPNNANLYMGGYDGWGNGLNAGANDRFLNGAMDEVRLWNSARSQAEIQAAYNAELSGSEAGLVGYWRMNQGAAEGDNTGVTTVAATTGSSGSLVNSDLSGSSSNWVTGMVSGAGAGTSQTKTFTVSNTGDGQLKLTSVSVTGGNTGDFFVNTAGMSTSIAQNSSTTFSVTFQPSAAGARQTTLRILSNDASQGTTDITLTGTGSSGNAAPTDITLTPSSLAENNAAGATVGTLAAVDSDAGQTHTFSLVSGTGDTDNGSFSITGSSLKIGVVADYESKSSYSIRVQADDGEGGTYQKTLAVAVTNVNEAPVNITLTPSSLAENNAAGATVGSLSATDVDAGQTHSFSLVAGTGDTDNGSFSITGASLKIGVVADYESKSSYSIRVQADDGSGGLVQKTLTVSVTNANDAPTNITLSSSSILENNTAGAAVGSLSATDVDAGQTHSFSLVVGTGDTDNGSFSISGSSLKIGVVGSYATKSSYSVRVQADDGAGGVFAKVLTVTILPANQAPSFTLNVTAPPAALRSWSSNDQGVGTLPAGLGTPVDFSANGVHNLALKSNGTVVAWGNNNSGQTNVPAGLSNVVDVAAGYDHSLALKSDGTVVAWGSNGGGQCNVPAGLTGVTAISGGGFHSLALKSDGTVVAWGGNQWGQSTVPAGLTGVIAIGAARNHSIALKSDGTVVAWGDNADGQLNIPAGLANVTAISTNTFHNMALKNDGTIVVWGSNNFGERNVPAGLTGVVGIAAGGYHCLVLKSNGTVQAWGANWAGQLNIPADLGLVSRIEAGIGHNLVMSEAYPAGFGPVKVAEDSAAYVLNNAASSISAGPPSESSQVLTFLVSNDNNALFSVQPAISATGTLTFTPAANASGAAVVTVTLKDDGGTANGGVDTSAAKTFTITLTPMNDVPTDITLSPSSLAENNTAGATVGSLSAADVDAGQTHSFSLIAGSGDTDNGSFSISGTSLKLGVVANYEVKSSYSIRVQADDGAGGTFAKALTVTVTDVNDAPVITSNGGLATAAVSIAENTTAVTQASAVDEDLPAQSISYSLGGADAAFFSVNAGTGALAFTASPDYEAPLDQNADNVYQVTVIATDNGSPAAWSSQQIAVTVTDVPEFPEITVLGSGSEIVSGASAPSLLNGTDFGNVLLGSALSRSFTISNTDVAPLNFTGAPLVEISGVHAGNFAVTVMPSAVVAPMTGQTSFTLRFIPTGSGLRTAQVTLRSNDPDEGTYTFAIQGIGYSNNAGRISFAPSGYLVSQGASQVVLNISRVDGKAATSVRLTTAPGTPAVGYTAATPGLDYVHQDVIVSFPENATSRQVIVPLIPRSGGQPNYQFSALLSNPGDRTTLGTSSQATISIKAHVRPIVTVSTPRQSSVVNGLAPYNVTGTCTDGGKSGINRVEVKLNGGAPANATLSPTGSYLCDVLPLNGLNTLEVTAFDNRGVSSLPVSVTFTFTRHYKLEPPVSSLGNVTVVALPAASMSVVPKMSYKTVLPGTVVKMTATTKGTNTVFSHWTGLPADAVVNGNVMTFTMPAQDVLGIVAVFNSNSFKAPAGEGNTFYGVLQPASSSLNSIDSLVFLTGTMTDTGAFTGKVLIGGLTKSFSAQFFGNGSSAFGLTKTPTLGIASNRKISLTFVNGNVEATVSTLAGSTVVASGTARRIIYTPNRPIPLGFRNANSAASLGVPDSGYFSIAMPAKVQNPARDLSTYPQGDGIGTILMSKDGLVTYAGTLADDSKFTVSTGLVAGNNAPFLAQITSPGKTTTKGACLAGTLAFNTAPSNSDVTATNLIWIRPAEPLVSLYTAGWPGGIHLDAIGALYSKGRGVYASLSTGISPANGGVCELYFSSGKLNPDISVTSFSINSLNEVRKVPLTNTTFTLILTPNLAAFNGTFTPNWSGASKLTKPAFKGILLQKGTSKGGYGFFISNRTNDPDPESGRVTLGTP